MVCNRFVPWVGSYPAGQGVHTQGLWRATFGYVNRNQKLEERSPLKSTWLDQVQSNWELLLPALFALIVAMVAAWADRRYSTLDARQLPPPLRWAAALWPRRKLVIAALTAFGLSLIVIQVLSGFGMEKAIKRSVAEEPTFVKAREAAGTSQAEREKVEFQVDQKVAEYAVDYTFWAHLSILLLALAVLAVILSAALDRRGGKPPPRIMLQY